MQGFVMRGIGVQWFQRWQTGAGPTAHDGRDATCPPSLPPGWAGNPGDLSLYQEGGASSEEGGTLSPIQPPPFTSPLTLAVVCTVAVVSLR